MQPVNVTVERDVMTATLVDGENRNALGGALIEGSSDEV